MNELKAYIALIAELNPVPCQTVYLKSEADKIIGRHKYKRCLSNAKSCEYKWMNLEKMINTEYRTKELRLSQRWWRIWLKLAEKFKEAK